MAVAARLETLATDERRSQKRRRLHLEAALATSDDEALIHDISATGVLLETDAELEPFESLQFDLPEIGATQAVVIWSSGRYFGCEFTTPISKAAISAALLRAAAAGPVGPSPAAEPEVLELDSRDQFQAERELSFATRGRVIVTVSIALWVLIFWAVGIF
jgi:PilZ domain